MILIDEIQKAATLYNRLVMVAGSSGSGKTKALNEAAAQMGSRVINLGAELSQRLLDLTPRQRKLEIATLLNEIVSAVTFDVVFLDNTEILFDPVLEQDPLRLLQRISRDKTVVATWNGNIEKGMLIYAVPEHSEFRKYPVRDFIAISLEG